MPHQPKGQDEANRAVYFAPTVFKHYLSKDLTAQELACLRLCRTRVEGMAVLDMGVGTGRTTRHLQPLAKRYEAVDYSPAMVGFLQQAMPDVSVRQADWRDLSVFDNASFDFIFATSNVIDALGHEDRIKSLKEARRLLRPAGALAFSAHNLNYQYVRDPPRLQWTANPLFWPRNIAQYLRCRRNYLRLAPLSSETCDYALLTDKGHDYACLHYYATREIVVRQLAACSLRVVEVISNQGRSVSVGDDESTSPNFMYIAEHLP